jgi:hypothetical protein
MKLPVAIILIALLCTLAVLFSGCGQPTQPGKVVGVADTSAERQARIKDVRNIGWRQFVDDWDAFWLQDKDTRLSEYPIR